MCNSPRFLIILLLALFICNSPLAAQDFGGTPPSQHWSQINTDTARVIFPAGMDSTAKRVASIVHFLAASKPASLGNRLRKINIVLQKNTTTGNGYVGLGPFRSEFYLSPITNSLQEGSVAWPDQLAVHEYRHVQQFNNFHTGLSNFVYHLFGEEGFAVAVNAAIPDWFYEGDAVYNETITTNQGRGRLPMFLNAYPSLWQARKNYSWMKLRNGSLKDYVPNHYYLGYLLVNYGRMKYGTDFWAKVTQDAAAYRGLFYPFQKAIQEHAGISYQSFRDSAFEYYKKNTARVSTTRDQYVFPVNRHYVTSYSFPYQGSGDSLFYLKGSYRQRAAFYVKDNRGEHKLRIRDISIDDQFSYRNGKIVYAAYENDPRWISRDYGVIKILNVATNRQVTLTHRTKYFTPDISDNGDRVVAVQNSDDGKSELHVLDAANGEILQRIHAADIATFTDPKFYDSNRIVSAVRLTTGKMTLAMAEISSGNTVRLLPPSFNVLGYPSVDSGTVYFTASYLGNDDVFALRMSDRKLYRLTDGPLGNYFVNAAHGKLTWSAFTAEGFQLQQEDLAKASWTPVRESATETLLPKFAVDQPEHTGNILASDSLHRQFAVSPYAKDSHLFNFHSWRPYYENPIFTFSLYGENILNTLQTEIYYLYNRDEKTNAAGFSAVYGKWFPYINIGSEYTFDRRTQIANSRERWGQLDSRIGLSVPLSFTSGRTYKNLNFGSNYYYRHYFFRDSAFTKSSLSYFQHYISFSQLVPRATQHILPRSGYTLNLQFRHALNDFRSWQFLSTGSLYLPGIAANHNLVLDGAYQEIDTMGALFSNRFPYSRGYSGRYFSRMWKLGANYHFPIWHMDWGFANLLYIQRIRGNLFYDYTRVFSADKKQHRNQRSVGGELFFDTKWWNQYPLTFGMRVSYLLDRDQYDGFKGAFFELVWPVSIFPK